MSGIYHMNAAELLDNAVSIYKKSFKQQLIAAAVMMAVTSTAVAFLIVLLMIVGLVGIVNGAVDGGFTPALGLFFIIGLAAAVAISILTSSIGLVANMYIAQQVFYCRKPDFAIALKDTLRNIIPVFSGAVAAFIMTLPVYAIAGGIIAAFLSNVSSYRQTPFENIDAGVLPLIITISLISLLVLLLLLFVAALNILTIPVCLFERKYFFGAVSKSIRLIKKDYWLVIGLTVLSVAASFGVYYSLSSVFNILSAALRLLSNSLPPWHSLAVALVGLLGTAAAICANLLVKPFDGIFIALLYFNQKIKHEGLDMHMHIDQLEQDGELL